MAVKVSDMPVATLPLTGAEDVMIVQAGVSKKTPQATLTPFVSATFLVLTADGTLTQERVFTPSVGLVAVDGGAGAPYTVSVDPAIVALLAGTTPFTTDQQISNSDPAWRLFETDAAANNRLWAVEANGEELSVRAYLDNLSANSSAFRITRTDEVIDTIEFDVFANFLAGSLVDGDLTVNGILLALNVNPSIVMDSTFPEIRWSESDAAADNRLWTAYAETEQFVLATMSDVGVDTPFLRVDRTGNVIDLVTLAAVLVTVNASSGELRITGTDTLLAIHDTDAAVDEKIFWLRNSAGNFLLQTRTDAGGAGANAILIDRTGTVVDLIQLNATSITLNGVAATDFARLSQSNTFTSPLAGSGAPLILASERPGTIWNETNGPANEKFWMDYADAGERRFTTYDDTPANEVIWLSVNRTGTTVDSIALSATAITLNGVAATDFARLSQNNTFTAGTQTISSDAGGVLILRDNNAAADEKQYRIRIDTGEFLVNADTDAGTPTTTPLAINRTGTTIDSIALTATAITLNGVAATDFARLSQNNTFTGSGGVQLLISAALPYVAWNETDAAADNRYWGAVAQSEQFIMFVENDAHSAFTNWLVVDRTGTVIDSINLTGPLRTSANAEIARFTSSTARGGGNCYAQFYDPTGAKGYVGYGGGNDDMQVANLLNAALQFYTNNILRFEIEADGSWDINGTNGNSGDVLTSQGSAATPQWVAPGAGVGGSLYAYKSANESVTSSIVFQDDDALIILTLVNNGVYLVECFIVWDQNGSTANGIRARMRATNGSVTNQFAVSTVNTTATEIAPLAQIAGATGDGITLTIGTAGIVECMKITTTFISSGGGTGTIALEWAQNASNATATRVLTGSWLRVTRLT